MPPKTQVQIKNVRLGAPPKDAGLDTLPMPGADVREPTQDQLVEPVLDQAQVQALARDLAAGDQGAETPPERRASDGAVDQPGALRWGQDDVVKRAEFDGLARSVADSQHDIASTDRHVDLIDGRLDALRDSIAEVSSRVDGLVAGLDPALAARLQPLRAEIDILHKTMAAGGAPPRLDAVLQDLQRRLAAVESRNPDAADFRGAVRDVSDRVDELRRSLQPAVRDWWEEWRRESQAFAPAMDRGELVRHGDGYAVRPRAPLAYSGDGDLRAAVRQPGGAGMVEAPVVRFTVLTKGVQFLPVQNEDGSIGLRLNLQAGAQYPMGELSVPRTGDGTREVDFGYAVHIPPGWLADVTCAPQQPDKPLPQQRAYVTTLHGSTAPGTTLVLKLHCSTGARGVQSGTEVARLHLRRVEPAAFLVTDGVDAGSPQRVLERERESMDKDAEIQRLRQQLEALSGGSAGSRADVADPVMDSLRGGLNRVRDRGSVEFGGSHERRDATPPRDPADVWGRKS